MAFFGLFGKKEAPQATGEFDQNGNKLVSAEPTLEEMGVAQRGEYSSNDAQQSSVEQTAAALDLSQQEGLHVNDAMAQVQTQESVDAALAGGASEEEVVQSLEQQGWTVDAAPAVEAPVDSALVEAADVAQDLSTGEMTITPGVELTPAEAPVEAASEVSVAEVAPVVEPIVAPESLEASLDPIASEATPEADEQIVA